MPRIIDLSMAVEDHFRWPVERRLNSDHGKGDLFQVTWLRWPVHGFTHMDSTTSDVPLEATSARLGLQARAVASNWGTTPMTTQKTLRRLRKLAKYGVGPQARQREKAFEARARLERFRQPGRWAHDQEFTRRHYASYDAYHHQARQARWHRRSVAQNRGRGVRRIPGPLRELRAAERGAISAVLRARLGTEVRALHRLGHFAVGIDLEPGPDNHYVLPGDFHHIVFPDGSIDAIYTNVYHVFDLERVLGEVARLLRPGACSLLISNWATRKASSRANSRPLIGGNRQALVARLTAITRFASKT